jgi:formamidase
MRIEIDTTRSLREQPGTGHNRWHPEIPPIARIAPGEEITLETRDSLDGQLTASSTAADLVRARFGLSHSLTGRFTSKGPSRAIAADLRISKVVDVPNALVSAVLPLDVFAD